MLKRGDMLGCKRGQMTIFIIIAILIIVIGVLIFMFYPKIQETLGLTSVSPNAFIQDCIEDEIQQNIQTISIQGGSLTPENYVLYENNLIEYLCYTGEYYKPCVMQQPMLKEHIETEIKNSIKVTTNKCFDSLKENYEKRGYSVGMKRGDFYIELLPKKITANFEDDLTLTKDESSTRYENFRIVLNNNLYELVIIATSILNWEARYGDAETTIYMDYYPNIKVEKKLQTDGTTIYILTERSTGNKFQFASRSIAMPPGYGVSKIPKSQLRG